MGFGIAAAIGSAIGNIGGSLLGKKVDDNYAKKQFERTRKWDEYKMLHAHQMEMQDLKKAGINPAYTALTGGANSGTIGGVGGSGTDLGNIGTNFVNDMNSIKSVEQHGEEIQNQKELQTSEIGYNNAKQNQIETETDLYPERVQQDIKESRSRIGLNNAEALESESRAQLNEANITLAGQESTINDINIHIKQIEEEIKTGNFGKAMAYANELFDTVKNGGQAFSSFVTPIMAIKGATNIKDLAKTLKDFNNSNIGKLLKTYKKK